MLFWKPIYAYDLFRIAEVVKFDLAIFRPSDGTNVVDGVRWVFDGVSEEALGNVSGGAISICQSPENPGQQDQKGATSKISRRFALPQHFGKYGQGRKYIQQTRDCQGIYGLYFSVVISGVVPDQLMAGRGGKYTQYSMAEVWDDQVENFLGTITLPE